jgi:hypothetical protein
VQAIIKECIDVCDASGIKIEPVQGKDIVKLLDYRGAVKKAISFFIIPLAIRKHARLKASMLQDLEKGKKTEVDSINGAVCAQGRKAGVPIPMNDKVVEIIHRIEQDELTASGSGMQKPAAPRQARGPQASSLRQAQRPFGTVVTRRILRSQGRRSPSRSGRRRRNGSLNRQAQ